MRIASLSGALLLALVLPASAQTVVVRPPIRVVRVLPAPPPRTVIVQAPAPVVRETPLFGIRPGCLSILGFPLVCARD